MPSVYPLKPAFQRLLRPWVGWLAIQGVTANQITVAALPLALVPGINPLLIALFVPLALLTEFAGVLAIACVLALSTTVNRSRAALHEIGG